MICIRLLESAWQLYISNLEYRVSVEDIKGTAEVVYSRRADAFAATKRYNSIQLDGKPIKIETGCKHLDTCSVYCYCWIWFYCYCKRGHVRNCCLYLLLITIGS